MMKSFLKVALGLGLLFGHVGAEAVQVSRLNEADVAVSSRSSAELEQAIKDALAKVLVKNSGSTEKIGRAHV